MTARAAPAVTRPAPPYLAVGLAAVVPLLALLGLLWPSLHFIWVDRPAYSHGYLVLGVVAWLVYRVARATPIPELRPSAWGGLALAATVCVAVLGGATDVALLPQLAIPALPLATLWAVAGMAAMRPFILPCGYLVFALPIWDVLNEPLRQLTVVVAGALTRQASIPAFIQGDIIRIPSGTFVVEGGCSGLHFLIVACALAALYALVAYERWWQRIVAVAVAAAVAMVANWVRVFVVILAGHLTEMEHYLVSVDHYTFGWVLFLVFFIPLLLVARRFEPLVEAIGGEEPMGVAGAQFSSRDGGIVRGLSACAIVLWLGVWLTHRATTRPAAADSPALEVVLPAVLGSWRTVGDWETGPRPSFMGADLTATGAYESPGGGAGRVEVYAASYGVQQQGKEAVFYANVVVSPAEAVVDHGSFVAHLPEGDLAMTELEVGGAPEVRRVVWYGYRIAGHTTGSAVAAKLYQALGAIEGRWDAQVIVMSAPCGSSDCAAARRSLREFAEGAAPALWAFIEDSRETA